MLFFITGGSVEVMVTFAPDHASDHYSDGVKIELFGKVCFKFLGSFENGC